MEVLPDLVGARPVVVFCGMAGAQSMKSREHYFQTPGNAFWELLFASGLVSEQLGPTDDARLPAFGLGLTDLVRHRDPEWFEIDALLGKLRAWEPELLALTSKTVAAAVARELGHRPPGLGLAPWDVAGAQVYVLPGSSGANRRADYDGRPDRLSWWQDLAALARP